MLNDEGTSQMTSDEPDFARVFPVSWFMITSSLIVRHSSVVIGHSPKRSFITERDDRIDAGSATRRDKAGGESDQTEEESRSSEQGRIMRGDFVELRREEATENENG